MAGQKPSLAGRGVEILFGEQSTPSSGGKMRQSAQNTRAAQVRFAAELTAMLEAEARSARGSQGELMGGSRDVALYDRTTPSPAQAPSLGRAKELPRVAPAASLPPAGPMPGSGDGPAKIGSAPSADPDRPAEEDALGPSMDALLRPDAPESAAIDLREPTAHEQDQPSHAGEEGDVTDLIGVERREALWDQITVLYREVPVTLSADPLQDEALQLLQEAQDILVERPRQFDLAQYKVGQVRSIIVRRKNTVRWTNSWGWVVFFYQVLWVAALAQAILLAPYHVGQIEALIGGAERYISLGQLWNTAAWGSVGGVLGALYSLYWHAAKVKDFDKQYVMWYVAQPVTGLIIGALVYTVVDAGLLSLISGKGAVQQLTIQVLPYTLACIAAFRQRIILEIVDRVIQVLAGAETKAASGAAATQEVALADVSLPRE